MRDSIQFEDAIFTQEIACEILKENPHMIR